MSYWRQPHYDPAYDYGYPDYGRHAPSYGRSYGYEGGYGGRSHGVGGYGGGRSNRGATNRGGGGGYGGNRRHDDNRKRSFRDQSTSKSKTSSKPSAEYYFENGFRKVYPYFFTFFTNAQKRWEDKQLLDVFMEEFPTNTKENYIKGIETGSILVNDQRVPLDYTLKIGDTVSSNTHRHEDPVLDLPIEIIHEDRDLLVVNKPPGVPCNPTGRFKANSVASILQADLNLSYLKNMYHVDWQSSGLMVFAKNGKTMDNLERFIHGGYVRKQFVARVVGEFPLGKVTVDNNQEIVSHKLSLWKISKTGGKPSSTVFERITYNGKSSVVKCIPEVGRTAHQIRVHLQYLGHPIINDPVYNSEAWGPNKGKGAVYEKPMEEVIEDLSRLSKISSIGEWLDEENPILAEKAAKEAADLEKKKQEEAEKAAEAEKKAAEAESEEKMAEGDGDGEKDGEEDGKMAEGDAEKEAEEDGKMTEGESEKDGAEEVKEENGKESKPDEEAADEDGKGEESEEVTAMDTSESGEPQAKRVKTDDEEEGAGDASSKVACSRYKTRGQIFVVQHKPFNVDKWNPAENCAECLKKYVEPQKDTMTLYLHAQMFESPNWQYYSKLPDWAKEDWKEPEEEEEES